jgi:hypothetical protein
MTYSCTSIVFLGGMVDLMADFPAFVIDKATFPFGRSKEVDNRV